jgi:hypothetical protein
MGVVLLSLLQFFKPADRIVYIFIDLAPLPPSLVHETAAPAIT